MIIFALYPPAAVGRGRCLLKESAVTMALGTKTLEAKLRTFPGVTLSQKYNTFPDLLGCNG